MEIQSTSCNLVTISNTKKRKAKEDGGLSVGNHDVCDKKLLREKGIVCALTVVKSTVAALLHAFEGRG